MKVADIFNPPSGPIMVTDLKALGCAGTGGYFYDNDVSSVNTWLRDHVTSLEQATMPFLPIGTIRSNTTPSTDVLLHGEPNNGVGLVGLGRTSGAVAFDVEDTATPDFNYLAARINDLRVLGYGPIDGYFWTTQANGGPPQLASVYGSLFDNWWYGWDGSTASDIPAGGKWQGRQYGQEWGASGRLYDVNIFNQAMFGAFAPPVIGGDVMPAEIVNPPISVTGTTVLLAQVNTNRVQAFVDAVDVSGSGSSVGVALVGDDGNDIASARLSPPANGTAEWVVPANQVGTLVARTPTAPIVCSVKQATLS